MGERFGALATEFLPGLPRLHPRRWLLRRNRHPWARVRELRLRQRTMPSRSVTAAPKTNSYAVSQSRVATSERLNPKRTAVAQIHSMGGVSHRVSPDCPQVVDCFLVACTILRARGRVCVHNTYQVGKGRVGAYSRCRFARSSQELSSSVVMPIVANRLTGED